MGNNKRNADRASVNQTPFKLTVFASDKTPLNKTITLVDGKLNKVANCLFFDGGVEVVDCPGLGGFEKLLKEGASKVAFAMGRPYRDGKWLGSASIVTKGKMGGVSDPDVISRSKKFFQFTLLLHTENCASILDVIAPNG